MKKRILSCLMALALCLTLLPATALAEEDGHAHCVCGLTHKEIGDHTADTKITFDKWLTSSYEGRTLVLRACATDDVDGTSVQTDDSGWLLPAGAYYLQSEVTIDKPIVIRGGGRRSPSA